MKIQDMMDQLLGSEIDPGETTVSAEPDDTMVKTHSAAVDLGSPDLDRPVAQPSNVLTMLDEVARMVQDEAPGAPTTFMPGANGLVIDAAPAPASMLNDGMRVFSEGLSTSESSETPDRVSAQMHEITRQPAVSQRYGDLERQLQSIIGNYTEQNLHQTPDPTRRGMGYGADGNATGRSGKPDNATREGSKASFDTGGIESMAAQMEQLLGGYLSEATSYLGKKSS